MLPSRLIRAYRWFRGRSGAVGRDAAVALYLARAELAVKDAGIRWSWEDDPYAWSDWHSDVRRGYSQESDRPERIEMVLAIGPDDEPLPVSLCGIFDADDDYRRLVQAELASEAIDALLTREVGTVLPI
jgi:hypothetical protein